MWKYGFTSVAGSAHEKAALPCQDASRADVFAAPSGEEIFVAVASDGAGSAAQAQQGAQWACDLFLADAQAHFANGGDWNDLASGFIAPWIEKFQATVGNWSGADGAITDFACTLLAVVAGREQTVWFHLGDGAIVLSPRQNAAQYLCVSWPQQGEYANTTHFLTDADATANVVCESNFGAADEIALFTDGLQNLVLDYRQRTAHAPFFASLFAWLRPQPDGYSTELSASLRTYLNSEKVNARTDDDKTLVLATRRQS